eukprot:TRINITY_DN12750_c0_g1_i7.p1 TRINITY_DN12750_c0_g1~~TRINITY_DN12750_c0_g1_i7.p1  ORF type:complete len:629 (-),score=114.36 TRINITY_DN12750_c0_g1_i7:202-2088(-)
MKLVAAMGPVPRWWLFFTVVLPGAWTAKFHSVAGKTTEVEADKRDGNRTLLIQSLTKTSVSWKPTAGSAMSAQLAQMKSNVADEQNDFFIMGLEQTASFFALAVCAGDPQAALTGLKAAAPGLVIPAISIANPLLGFAVAIMYSTFSQLFGWGAPSGTSQSAVAMRKLSERILAHVDKQLMLTKFQERMEHAQREVQGIIEAMNSIPGPVFGMEELIGRCPEGRVISQKGSMSFDQCESACLSNHANCSLITEDTGCMQVPPSGYTLKATDVGFCEMNTYQVKSGIAPKPNSHACCQFSFDDYKNKPIGDPNDCVSVCNLNSDCKYISRTAAGWCSLSKDCDPEDLKSGDYYVFEKAAYVERSLVEIGDNYDPRTGTWCGSEGCCGCPGRCSKCWKHKDTGVCDSVAYDGSTCKLMSHLQCTSYTDDARDCTKISADGSHNTRCSVKVEKDVQTTWFLNMHQQMLTLAVHVFGACIDGTGSDCDMWNRLGLTDLHLAFLQLHLQVVAELIRLNPSWLDMQEQFCALGAKYYHLSKSALDWWKFWVLQGDGCDSSNLVYHEGKTNPWSGFTFTSKTECKTQVEPFTWYWEVELVGGKDSKDNQRTGFFPQGDQEWPQWCKKNYPDIAWV